MAELKPLSDLYNDYAAPREMWDMCLDIFHFSSYRDADGDIARGLWWGGGASSTPAP